VTIVLVDAIPGADRAWVSLVMTKARVVAEPPEGLVTQCTAQDGDGVLIIGVWDSKEHYDRFAAERLAPAIAAVRKQRGRDIPGVARQFVYESSDLVRGPVPRIPAPRRPTAKRATATAVSPMRAARGG
jgi:hypothetical protein